MAGRKRLLSHAERGRKGGKKRMAAMTPAQIAALGRKGGNSLWKRIRSGKLAKASHKPAKTRRKPARGRAGRRGASDSERAA